MKSLSLSHVLELPVEDRLRLVEMIWDSISAMPEAVPITDALRADLDDRLRALEERPASTYDWDEVKSRIGKGECGSG